MDEIFSINESLQCSSRNLRNTETDLRLPKKKSANGQKCFSFRGAKLWNSLPAESKMAYSLNSFKNPFKGAGSRNRKQTYYLYNLYYFPHVAIVFCTICSAQILVDGVNPLESYLKNSTNISAIVQHMSVSFASLQSSRVRLRNRTAILRNIVEDLCDTAYQKYCKIVILKEVCLLSSTE